MIVARACYSKCEHGFSREDAEEFKQECCNKIRAATRNNAFLAVFCRKNH